MTPALMTDYSGLAVDRRSYARLLEAHAGPFADSKRFGTLLLAFLNHRGGQPQLDADALRALRRAAEAHRTFLRKACLAALDRLDAETT